MFQPNAGTWVLRPKQGPPVQGYEGGQSEPELLQSEPSQGQGYDWRMTALGGGTRAAKSAAEDIMAGKPINRTKAAVAAVGEGNFNRAKGAYDQANKLREGNNPMKSIDPRPGKRPNGKKPGNKKGGKRKGGSNGFGNNNYYGGGDNSYSGNAAGGTPTNKLSSVTPYAVTLPGSKVEINTINDGSLYHLPYSTQNGNPSDVENNDYGVVSYKTTLRIIDLTNILKFAQTAGGYTNDLIIDAAHRIFGELKMEVNALTNGGNTVTKNTFTFLKFWSYLSVAAQAHAMLCEIEARMTWAPSVEESNLLIRDVKNVMTSDPELFIARNRLRDEVSVMCLPVGLMNYFMKVFPVYKKSPVMGGPVELYMSNTLAFDLGTMTAGTQAGSFNTTKARIEELVNLIRLNFDEYAQITALLIDKTNFDYVSQRYRKGALDYPCYDDVQNGIFNNLPYHFQLGDNSDFDAFGGTQLTVNDPVIALPMNPGDVPIYLTGHLLSLYPNGDFPFFSENISDWGPDLPSLSYTSNMVLETDRSAANAYGFRTRVCDRAQRMVTDHMVTLCKTGTPVTISDVEMLLVPKGLNVRRYQPSFESLSTACVQLMYTLFGVDL
jgi:hypothetical protein